MFWQHAAGFACLGLGLAAWGLALAVATTDSRPEDPAGTDISVVAFLLAIGCPAFAGAVELL
jgi:hypothetical protein